MMPLHNRDEVHAGGDAACNIYFALITVNLLAMWSYDLHFGAYRPVLSGGVATFNTTLRDNEAYYGWTDFENYTIYENGSKQTVNFLVSFLKK